MVVGGMAFGIGLFDEVAACIIGGLGDLFGGGGGDVAGCGEDLDGLHAAIAGVIFILFAVAGVVNGGE